VSKIVSTPFEDILLEAYVAYAKDVITNRAIPHALDGLKPVHRRILHTMYEMGNFHNKPFRKSARIVGDVIGKYHPHGDSAVYETIVRMAQPFSTRYPLVEGQGNFGSVDGDPPAAMRYTECRLTELASDMIKGYKDIADFIPNYDNTAKEPIILPVRIPLLLINGSSGIAVGLSTSIFPHNIVNVIDACIAYINNPDIRVEELVDIIEGPDFPLGGYVRKTVEPYIKGEGKFTYRAHIETEDKYVVIKSIPYGITKFTLINKIHNKLVDFLKDMKDESGKDICIRLLPKPGVTINSFLDKLYRIGLQTTLSMKFVAIHENTPVTYNLKNYIACFVNNRLAVISKDIRHKLQEWNKSLVKYQVLVKVCKNIDKVVKVLSSSKDSGIIKKRLMSILSITDNEVSYVLDLKLSSLTKKSKMMLEEEMNKLKKIIDKHNEILKHNEKLKQALIDDLKYFKDKFGDERKTEVVDKFQRIESSNIPILTTSSSYFICVEKTNLIRKSRYPRNFHKYDNIFPVTRDMYIGIFSCKECSFYAIPVSDIATNRPHVFASSLQNISNYRLVAFKPSDKCLVAFDSGHCLFWEIKCAINTRKLRELVSGQLCITDTHIIKEQDINEGYLLCISEHGYCAGFELKNIIFKKSGKGIKFLNLTDDKLIFADIIKPNDSVWVLYDTGEFYNLIDVPIYKNNPNKGKKLLTENILAVYKIPSNVKNVFIYDGEDVQTCQKDNFPPLKNINKDKVRIYWR